MRSLEFLYFRKESEKLIDYKTFVSGILKMSMELEAVVSCSNILYLILEITHFPSNFELM